MSKLPQWGHLGNEMMPLTKMLIDEVQYFHLLLSYLGRNNVFVDLQVYVIDL
jgi:hypothetical protein